MELWKRAYGSIDWAIIDRKSAADAVASKAAPGVGRRHVVLGFSISVSAAPTSAVLAVLKDGTTVIDQFEIPAALFAPIVVNFPRGFMVSENAAVSLTVPNFGGAGNCSVVLKGFTAAA